VRETIGISVVVPSYNHGRFIDAAIRSLLDQEYPNLEIIVVDGGSTDDTVQTLRAYGDRISWTSEPDQGQCDAIIKGFARASKDWFVWLNSDDTQCNRALWRVNDAVRGNPFVQVVVGGGHYMAEDGSFLRPYPTIAVAEDTDLKREFFERGYVAQPSVFFAKALYERVGGLSRSVHFCMDYDLWCKFALAYARFV
jgi:glycosyltransferase involved in cell wall biosynthesis